MINLLPLLLLGAAVIGVFIEWGCLDDDEDDTEEWERKAW